MSTISSPGPLQTEHDNTTPRTDPGSEAMWDCPSTGTHQTNSGHIVVSSLAKAKRKRILPHQYNRLMYVFEQTDTPSSEMREQLAIELEMTKREVQVWFQNRRAKNSRARVKAAGGSSMAGHRRRQSHSMTPSSTKPFIDSSHLRRASAYPMMGRVQRLPAFRDVQPVMPVVGHLNSLTDMPVMRNGGPERAPRRD
ncbi:Mix paired-like homeobox [Apophysomyces sp. BC1034]|nr:Mix paired-like homeobox [Apophysomyces sp. BC1021]KAG0192037.1 Mix paired-like homeobox [Apophysomyces sp. BC1034]